MRYVALTASDDRWIFVEAGDRSSEPSRYRDSYPCRRSRYESQRIDTLR